MKNLLKVLLVMIIAMILSACESDADIASRNLSTDSLYRNNYNS